MQLSFFGLNLSIYGKIYKKFYDFFTHKLASVNGRKIRNAVIGQNHMIIGHSNVIRKYKNGYKGQLKNVVKMM